MFGMLKKEFFMIKNNMKALITAMIIYAFYSFMFNMNLIGFLPMMMAMICISTFSYDDFNNWHAYLVTTPNGKKNAVKAKYVMAIISMILSIIIAYAITFIFSKINSEIVLDNTIETLFGTIIAILAIISIIFPFMFKYPAEKGRLVMILVGLVIAGVALLFKNVINPNDFGNVIAFMDKYGALIFSGISIIMALISYLLSVKFYLKREF